MTRLDSAPPVGFIAASELVREPHSFLRSGLPLRQAQGTMPSADFCLLTQYVAIQGTAGLLMRRCLFRGSLGDSYPPTAIEYARFLVFRLNPSRILPITSLPHAKQISPDKNVNFPCTTAAFTLPPEPLGFVVLCQLAQELSLVCGFCLPDQVRDRLGSHVCTPASFGPLLAETPLPSASTFGSIH